MLIGSYIIQNQAILEKPKANKSYKEYTGVSKGEYCDNMCGISHIYLARFLIAFHKECQS